MSANDNVWIVDDDRSIRWVLEKALMQEGLTVTVFEEAQLLLNKLAKEQPHAIVTDIRMPNIDGLTLLAKIRIDHPDIPVIVMTAHSDLDSAVSSYQGGAFEYLPKPFDVDDAINLVKRAIAHHHEQHRNSFPAVAAPKSVDIIGESPAMQEVFRAIGRLSHSHITVLINGESGTGKELVAHALHRHSPRSSRPFIALNMAAIPKDLMESELFGHEKGAFTGAVSARQGRDVLAAIRRRTALPIRQLVLTHVRQEFLFGAAAFEAEGCAPFVYEAQGKRVPMSYWTVPDEALDSPQEFRPWAQRAWEAALRKPKAKPKKRKASKRKMGSE